MEIVLLKLCVFCGNRNQQ